MSNRYFYSKEVDGRQEPAGRVSCKTLMTRDYFSKPGNRGMELAAGLAQVNLETIAKALVDEKMIACRIEELSRTNPENSLRLQRAERVHRAANPFLAIPIAVASAACAMVNPILGFVVAGVGLVSLVSASIWAWRVRAGEDPGRQGVEEAKKKLAEVRMAKAEVCAKTGLSERMVEMLQALPLDATQKHTVLKQAIFQDVPEDYVKRVAGILDGVAARRESLVEFAERRLEYISRDISQARELEEAAEKKASSGDKAQACALFVDAARILEKALDYAGAAEMYRKASGASPENGTKAAELGAKSAQCFAKAGNNPSAS